VGGGGTEGGEFVRSIGVGSGTVAVVCRDASDGGLVGRDEGFEAGDYGG
jgi:hypothetical protein